MFERTIRHVREVFGIHVRAGPHIGDARETCARALEPRTLNLSTSYTRLSGIYTVLVKYVITCYSRAREERFLRIVNYYWNAAVSKPYSYTIFIPAHVTVTIRENRLRNAYSDS